ncbi:MAG: 50S ribosomal protein L35 [Nitrospirota bacterium]|nr:50S ribosomal protein L35 [Nitrospirota bacterium]
MARQKLKTHRGAAKRFIRTKNGKVKRARAFARHLLTKKSAKRKRQYRSGAEVSAGEVRMIERLLPYG